MLCSVLAVRSFPPALGCSAQTPPILYEHPLRRYRRQPHAPSLLPSVRPPPAC
ncbi:hypothetical protein DAEQUDRAFT_724355 [Daedalea quercina L-15889]|uniref:Uncharacterized protein n=1 Tax=Daedalea quercina L-15889 TaxID=1314783 RepID=A0A165S0E6_9APHY|nr:hypothetical protein DAEQUDRAFT_724355 [Daedalea quercina L-15889]